MSIVNNSEGFSNDYLLAISIDIEYISYNVLQLVGL